MTTTLTLTEPVFVDCGCGWKGCNRCEGTGVIAVDLSWLATLCFNLAIGAALAEAYARGRYREAVAELGELRAGRYDERYHERQR